MKTKVTEVITYKKQTSKTEVITYKKQTSKTNYTIETALEYRPPLNICRKLFSEKK